MRASQKKRILSPLPRKYSSEVRLCVLCHERRAAQHRPAPQAHAIPNARTHFCSSVEKIEVCALRSKPWISSAMRSRSSSHVAGGQYPVGHKRRGMTRVGWPDRGQGGGGDGMYVVYARTLEDQVPIPLELPTERAPVRPFQRQLSGLDRLAALRHPCLVVWCMCSRGRWITAPVTVGSKPTTREARSLSSMHWPQQQSWLHVDGLAHISYQIAIDQSRWC